MLSDWISKYKENSYNIVEWKRGRSTMPKLIKKKDNETLEEENLYLKAEIEYSKNWELLFRQVRINNRRKSKCCKWASANIPINDSSKNIKIS